MSVSVSVSGISRLLTSAMRKSSRGPQTCAGGMRIPSRRKVVPLICSGGICTSLSLSLSETARAAGRGAMLPLVRREVLIVEAVIVPAGW